MWIDRFYIYRDYGISNPVVTVLSEEEPGENLTEAEARNAINQGISDVLSTAAIYTDQQIYVRYLNGSQMLGRFDKVAAYGNQRWAFNYITGSESYLRMNGLAPSLYIWENSSIGSWPTLQIQIESFISSTLSS